MAQYYTEAVQKVDTFLHQPGPVNDYSKKLEALTGVKRIYVAQGMYLSIIACFFSNFLKSFQPQIND